MRRPASYRGVIVGFALLFIACGIAYFSWPRPSNVASARVKSRPQDMGDAKRGPNAAKVPRPPTHKRPSQSNGAKPLTERDVIQLQDQPVPPPVLDPEPTPPPAIPDPVQPAVDALPQVVALPLQPNRQRPPAINQIPRDVIQRDPAPGRFLGAWDNPFLRSLLRLDKVQWTDMPNDDGPPSQGEWRLHPDGSINLFGYRGKNVLVLRLSEHALACQEEQPDNTMIEDGYLRFKQGYDWQGRTLRVIPVVQLHKQQLAGGWKHPNHGTKYVVKDRIWTESPKIGGLEMKGTWEPLNDGSFIATLDNHHRRRVWIVEANLLAILPLDHTGKMMSDGVLVLKE
jgi:hypothetical protein